MRQLAPVLPADSMPADPHCESRASIGTDHVATMVLDRMGTVRYCHDEAATLFGTGAESLLGKHINALIPDLPFHTRTPGYNVAYAAFWAPDGPRKLYCGVDSRGRPFDLQIALEKLELKKEQRILLSLRRPVEPVQSATQPAEFRACSRAGEAGVSAATE